VTACADGPDPYAELSFFLNTINKEPAFVPFYYSPSVVFYTDGYGFEENGFDDHVPDENLRMWQGYCRQEVPAADLDSFIYVFDASEVSRVYEHLGRGVALAVTEKTAANSFTRWLLKNKDVEAAQYLSFAKACQPYTGPLDGEWNSTSNSYELPKRDSAAMERLADEGMKLREQAKNREIRQRYAYQVLRMAFYSGQYDRTQELFDKLVPGPEDNFLYYRCLAMKAGAMYRSGDKTGAAYLYSRVFNETDDQKKTVYTSFRWAVNGDVKEVLKRCKNDHEKAGVYIMRGMYDYTGSEEPMIEALQSAYKLDPAVKGLEVLMTRCINKMEGEMIPGTAGDKNHHKENLAAPNTFAQKAAAGAKRGSAAYWNLCSAYLYLLGDDAANCQVYLGKAKTFKMTTNEAEVYSLINILYVIRRDGRINAGTEAELLPLLQGVEARAGREGRYASVYTNLMVTILSAAYAAQGDDVKAVYCYSRCGYAGISSAGYTEDYSSDGGKMLDNMPFEKLHAAEAFISNKDKTPYEQWLTGSTVYTEGALLELEGTRYIRMYEFGKAADVLARVPDTLLKKRQLPDVMVSHIQDSQDWNKSDSGASYNKLQFARKMLELQQAVTIDPKNGRAAYQYANALYNMSYYGKAHHAYDYYRSSTDAYAYFSYQDRNKLAPYEQEHYNVRTPEKYYLQAYENSTDREVKARCLFMAAKCWQKNCPVTDQGQNNYFPDEKEYYANTFRNPHLRRLKSEYGDTKFFANAAGTCSYFRDYVHAK